MYGARAGCHLQPSRGPGALWPPLHHPPEGVGVFGVLGRCAGCSSRHLDAEGNPLDRCDNERPLESAMAT